MTEKRQRIARHNRILVLFATALSSYPVTTVITSEAMDKIVAPAVTVCPVQAISCRRLAATVLQDAASNGGLLESLPSFRMYIATGCCGAKTIEKNAPRCLGNTVQEVSLPIFSCEDNLRTQKYTHVPVREDSHTTTYTYLHKHIDLLSLPLEKSRAHDSRQK